MTITTGTFKKRAIDKHGDVYDYSKSEYYKYHEKVTIICKTHGEFQQSPSKHLAGQKCPKCASANVHEHLKYKWTEKDLQIIKDNYKNIGLNLTSKLLNCSSSLIYKKAKELGLTKKFSKKTYHDKISKITWNSLVGGAKRRRLEVSITEDDIWDIFISQNKKCALTGVKLNLHKKSDKINASIDRIDSSKGYTKENTQIVSKRINKAKMNLPEKDFFILCKNVYMNLKDKKEYKNL